MLLEKEETTGVEGKWSAGDLQFYTKSELEKNISKFYYDNLVKANWLTDSEEQAIEVNNKLFSGESLGTLSEVMRLTLIACFGIECTLRKTEKQNERNTILFGDYSGESYMSDSFECMVAEFEGIINPESLADEINMSTSVQYYNYKGDLCYTLIRDLVKCSPGTRNVKLATRAINFGILFTGGGKNKESVLEIYKKFLPQKNIDGGDIMYMVVDAVAVNASIQLCKKYFKVDIRKHILDALPSVLIKLDNTKGDN